MAQPASVVASVLDELLVESRAEFVEVWKVLWMTRYALCNGDYPIDVQERTDPIQVRQLAIAVIASALESGVRAGFYSDAKSDEYPPPLSTGSPAEVINRLEKEWDARGMNQRWQIC